MTDRIETSNLLIENGADVNAVTNDGETPLFYASGMHGRIEIVSQLLKKGAKVNAKTKKGETALKEATTYKNKGIINILKENGASP